jgi:hypothetical protein
VGQVIATGMTEQKINNPGLFNFIFIPVAIAVFIIAAKRCNTMPFNHDEIATFFNDIQPGDFWPYNDHMYEGNHFLNSCLSWVCFKLLGDSPLAIRLPNLLALIVLIMAVYRISKQLTHTHSRLILMAGFLLSFHWLSFFSVCRGYGISMAFLMLSISYLTEYFNSKNLRKLFLFYLFIQVAICAHLIIVIVATGLTLTTLLFQLLNKQLFNKWNLIVLLLHGLLILFWIKFSFNMQEQHLLYFISDRTGYWNITFITLIQLLSGSTNRWIPLFVLSGFFILMAVVLILSFSKVKKSFQNLFTPSLFYPLILIGIIAAFYLLNLFLNINFPADRGGLSFYVFFVLSVVFLTDQFTGMPVRAISLIILAGAMVHFAFSLNFNKHSLAEYDTIPQEFYTRLLEEQRSGAGELIVGGQVAREFIYESAYINYRRNRALNIIDASSDELHMNADYELIWGFQEKYYSPWYDKIDFNKDWNIALLKRREKIKRNFLLSVDSAKTIQGKGEYFTLFDAKDTAFNNTNPLLLEFDIKSVQGEMPLKAWLVLEIDTSEGHASCFKWMPLNKIKYDWSGTNDDVIDLVSEQLPARIHRLRCYLWNLKKKELKLEMNSLKIYQLEGEGINIIYHTNGWKVL